MDSWTSPSDRPEPFRPSEGKLDSQLNRSPIVRERTEKKKGALAPFQFSCAATSTTMLTVVRFS